MHSTGSFRHTRMRPAVLFGGLLAFLLLLTTVSATPSSAAVDSVLPESGALVGAFTKPRDGDFTKDGVKRRWKKLEDGVGRTLGIGHLFEPWGAKFPGWEEEWHAANGRVPLVSWAHTYAADVAAGKHDAHIRAQADRVKSFKKPIMIRWFWEMDGNNKAKYAKDPSTYIKAWRRIVQTFRDRGANNAQFVWCPNAWAFTKGNAAKWYPGDQYVDWLCANGYNWNPGRKGDVWRDLADIFQSYHDWGKKRGKPMMIGETGVMERKSGEKAAWYRQALADLEKKLPHIDAINFFDTKRKYDWRVDSTQASFKAWKEIVNDPYLTGGQVFADAFEAGLGRWDHVENVTIDRTRGGASGAPSAKAAATNGPAVLRASLRSGQDALCVSTSVRLTSQDGNVTLIRLQNSAENVIGRVYVHGATRELRVQSTKTGRTERSNQVLPRNEWHEITLCARRGLDNGRWVLEYDGKEVVDWRTRTSNKRIRAIRLGQGGKSSFVVRFDDVSAWIPDGDPF